MTSMHPMLSRMFGEHRFGASSAEAGTGKRDASRVTRIPPTNVQLLERPLACNHGAIFLLLLLLANPKVNQRAAVGRLTQLQVLPIAIALIHTVYVNEDRNARGDEIVGSKVDGERLRLAGNRYESLDEAVAVYGTELL
jgi:hypothetical protein